MNYDLQIQEFLKESSFFYTIAIGLDSRYMYVSQNYNRNFDSTGKSLLGEHFSITLHPEDIAICERVGEQCFLEPGKLLPATLRKHDGKGGFVTTQWEMRALIDKEGKPEGIFCVGYNISEFVITKDQLSTATNHLTEIGYIQSHRVRKPLANIIGLTEMIISANGQENLQTISKMLHQSSSELDEVIKQISGKTEVIPTDPINED
ncbi:MAG: PAS domain-containing protein [Bacteroidota bacterium]